MKSSIRPFTLGLILPLLVVSCGGQPESRDFDKIAVGLTYEE